MDCHNKQPPHGPGEDVLNAHAPPELEYVSDYGVQGIRAQTDHVSGDGSNTREEDFVVPFFDGKFALIFGNKTRGNSNEDVPAPENGNRNPGLLREGEVCEPWEGN